MSQLLKYSFGSGDAELRQKAREDFERLNLPESIRTPGRTWTRYPKNLEEELDAVQDVEPEIESEGDVKVYRNAEAFEKAGENLLDAVKRDENRITALHTVMMNSLIYLEVEGEAEVNITYEENSPVFAHLVVDTAQSSELALTEEFRGNPEIQTSINEFYLGDNTTMSYGAVESVESGFSYSIRKAVLGRDASIDWLNSMFGGDLNRTRIETVLKGDNSSVDKTGVWYPVGEQHIDISLQAYHIGENTSCDMDSRAVVDDTSRSVYEGLQQVQDSADDTKSFQDQKTLMLSDRAESDASPKLMIEDPDVEASHAASSGTVPEEELHYMKSRGISEEKARRLVVKGYFEPVMEEIELPQLKETVREEVEKKLQN